MKKNGFGKPNYIIYVLAAVLAAGSFSVIQSAMAQNKRIRDAEKKENYNRPAPARPIKPTIPDANRYQDDKVFLEYADSLFRPAHEYEEFQVVKGSVKFRQGGMWMFCDSVYYSGMSRFVREIPCLSLPINCIMTVFPNMPHSLMARHAVMSF